MVRDKTRIQFDDVTGDVVWFGLAVCTRLSLLSIVLATRIHSVVTAALCTACVPWVWWGAGRVKGSRHHQLRRVLTAGGLTSACPEWPAVLLSWF